MNTKYVEYVSRQYRMNNTTLASFINPNDIIGRIYHLYIFNAELNKVLIREGIQPKDLSSYDEAIPRFKGLIIKTMADQLDFCCIEDYQIFCKILGRKIEKL